MSHLLPVPLPCDGMQGSVNAMLQALLPHEGWFSVVIKLVRECMKYRPGATVTQRQATSYQLLLELVKVQCDLRKQKTDIATEKFVEQLFALKPRFRALGQHDTQHLLTCVLDEIVSINRLAGSTFTLTTSFSMVSTIECAKCRTRTSTDDVAEMIHVNVPTDGSAAVEGWSPIGEWRKGTALTGSSRPKCKQCGGKQDATKELSIQHLPSGTLIVHLNLIPNSQYTTNFTRVRVPMMVLASELGVDSPDRYQCESIVAQTSAGQFVCLRRNPHDPKGITWIVHNDQRIEPTGVPTEFGEDRSPHLLLYRRV